MTVRIVHFPTIGVTLTREVPDPQQPSDAEALRRIAAELVALLEALASPQDPVWRDSAQRAALGLGRALVRRLAPL